jgi:acyl-coenzyme A synthetase/AMP-(fatty) acid ligase
MFLSDFLGIGAPATGSGEFRDRNAAVALSALAFESTFGTQLESLRGRRVLLATRSQLSTALALMELDGIAGGVVLCTPDLSNSQLLAVSQAARADSIVRETADAEDVVGLTPYIMTPSPGPGAVPRRASEATEWILLTSGTSGTPKLVVHTLQTLAGTLPRRSASAGPVVWSTFYDIRRYGGLQIYLRAVLGGVPLILGSIDEPIAEFIMRAAQAGVTHMSGTPSHWRQALLSGAAAYFQPDYLRLSGEVADQALLDRLHTAFPKTRISHAFASTEAGVAFEVSDGLAGFPVEYIGRPGVVELTVANGTLHIRSPGHALRYQGDARPIRGADGYVDTGDKVERVADRYYFRGRHGGIINVGGLKVYPEEVESVLNAHPRVRLSRVSARPNPITGSVVVADVVLDSTVQSEESSGAQAVKNDLLDTCRRTLPAHKVPAVLRFVAEIELTAAGKLVRANA